MCLKFDFPFHTKPFILNYKALIGLVVVIIYLPFHTEKNSWKSFIRVKGREVVCMFLLFIFLKLSLHKLKNKQSECLSEMKDALSVLTFHSYLWLFSVIRRQSSTSTASHLRNTSQVKCPRSHSSQTKGGQTFLRPWVSMMTEERGGSVCVCVCVRVLKIILKPELI